ncbi:hypothetical protein P1X16_28995 [Hymenobacter sp. YC55]|nr:hypothetical protein [Hymenobacter sp. YC55]
MTTILSPFAFIASSRFDTGSLCSAAYSFRLVTYSACIHFYAGQSLYHYLTFSPALLRFPLICFQQPVLFLLANSRRLSLLPQSFYSAGLFSQVLSFFDDTDFSLPGFFPLLLLPLIPATSPDAFLTGINCNYPAPAPSVAILWFLPRLSPFHPVRKQAVG